MKIRTKVRRNFVAKIHQHKECVITQKTKSRLKLYQDEIKTKIRLNSIGTRSAYIPVRMNRSIITVLERVQGSKQDNCTLMDITCNILIDACLAREFIMGKGSLNNIQIRCYNYVIPINQVCESVNKVMESPSLETVN